MRLNEKMGRDRNKIDSKENLVTVGADWSLLGDTLLIRTHCLYLRVSTVIF